MRIIFLTSFLLFTTISSIFANNPSFRVRGKITGLKDGVTFYLIRSNDEGGADTLISCTSSHGKFEMYSNEPKLGEIVFIKMDTAKVTIGENRTSWFRLLVDDSDVRVSGTFDNWPNVEIQGSKATKDFESLEKERERLMNQSMEEIREKKYLNIEESKRKYADSLLGLIRRFSNSLATPIIALNSGLSDTLFYLDAYNSLADIAKNSYGGAKLKSYIPILKMMANIKPGNKIPDFKVFSADGEFISIREICKNNKLTLIDFWASWCSPCKAAIPTLLEVYTEYKTEGFNIVGLSSDHDKNEWKKALNELSVPWQQFIEGETKVGKDIFGLGSIPAYVLIDNNGEILAFDRGLSPIPSFGPSLRETELKKVISNYLSKNSQAKQ